MCFKWCWSCCTCLRQGLSAFLVMKCHLNNQTWTLCSKQKICIRQFGAVQCKMTMKAANVTQKLTNSLIRWLEDFEHCNLTGCLAFLRAPPKIHPKSSETSRKTFTFQAWPGPCTLDQELKQTASWQVHHGRNEEVQGAALQRHLRFVHLGRQNSSAIC